MKLHLRSIILILSFAVPLFAVLYACNKNSAQPVNYLSQQAAATQQSNAVAISVNDRFLQFKKSIGYNPESCIQPGGTGPYDPSACFEKELKDLTYLQKKAGSDVQLGDFISKQYTSVATALKTWQSLPAKEKLKRQAIFATSSKQIIAGKYDFEAVLGRYQTSVSDPETKAMITAFFRDPKTGCIFNCVCVQMIGCPCCGWEDWTRTVYGWPYSL